MSVMMRTSRHLCHGALQLRELDHVVDYLHHLRALAQGARHPDHGCRQYITRMKGSTPDVEGNTADTEGCTVGVHGGISLCMPGLLLCSNEAGVRGAMMNI